MSGTLVESISKIDIAGTGEKKIGQAPVDPVPLAIDIDDDVVRAFPTPGSTLIDAQRFGESLWGTTTKLVVQLPDGTIENYFLKVVSNLGIVGRRMCEGEYESMKAIDAVSPGFVPKAYAWGKFSKLDESYFLLLEFREVGRQPAEPTRLASKLADLHFRSVSPTGKFGFHVATVHAKIIQAVDQWDDSWCAVFSRHLGHIFDLARPILKWPEFDVVSKLTLDKVVPRLLLPLQSDGRVLKPSLIHGNCWDGNTAMDMKNGEAFVFDGCSFYGHNEYDTGNWRAPRHKLSNKEYIRNYKRHFPMSEPVEDWDSRNILYSLPFNIGNAIYVPGSSQRPVVYEDMTTLCKMFCPDDLRREMELLKERAAAEDNAGAASAVAEIKKSNALSGSESEEEEEEEEEEEDDDRSVDSPNSPQEYDVIWGRSEGKGASVAPMPVLSADVH